ncbi:hypothetical protein LVJ94_03130 [Pendulispora rubella]|uniref:Adenylate kinase n=1 Tax=Pendulispora rubella TaxID=2741070 RepID=A0ABZ2L9J5_9BACT
MQRVLVIGCSGVGKSTLSRRLATRLRVPYVELDALHHGAGWTPRPTFIADVDHSTRAPCWVTDGNYTAVREMLWDRADTVVWLDLPRLLVEWQVVQRSFVRWITRAELWNGCRERGPLHWLNPEHPIRWSWRKHSEYTERYGARFAEPKWAHLDRIRLVSRKDMRRFLASVGPIER